MFTEQFVRDTVLPEVASSGGATVLVSPYGMPPALLRMDAYQPPTWVVGLGYNPERVKLNDPEYADKVLAASNAILADWDRNAWSAVGYWVDDNELCVEPVETYTSHEMAVQAATDAQQVAIYALHTGRTEFIPLKLTRFIPDPV